MVLWPPISRWSSIRHRREKNAAIISPLKNWPGNSVESCSSCSGLMPKYRMVQKSGHPYCFSGVRFFGPPITEMASYRSTLRHWLRHFAYPSPRFYRRWKVKKIGLNFLLPFFKSPVCRNGAMYVKSKQNSGSPGDCSIYMYVLSNFSVVNLIPTPEKWGHSFALRKTDCKKCIESLIT